MALYTQSLFVTTDDQNSGDDDDISLTSTVEEGGDYDVEELLAERGDPDDPSQLQYLIKWEGYPLDQCTVCSFRFPCFIPPVCFHRSVTFNRYYGPVTDRTRACDRSNAIRSWSYKIPLADLADSGSPLNTWEKVYMKDGRK